MAITKKVAQLASQLNYIGQSADWQIGRLILTGRLFFNFVFNLDWVIGRLVD